MADTAIIRPIRPKTLAEDTVEPTSAATLDAWSRLEWTDGVQIDHLAPLETIEARTRNSVYELVVLDGRNGDVLVTGGQFFPTATRVRLNGCTAGGSCLKWRGIYCGFRMELQVGTDVIVTTRVQSVARLERASEGASVH